MASNFMGGFAKGFSDAYHTRRAEDRALERDLFRDTWSRYHDGLEKRNAQKQQEDLWAKNAAMLAQNDGEKQVFMNLFKSGMSFKEVQDWQKEYVVDINSPAPQAPQGPSTVAQHVGQKPEGPDSLAAQEAALRPPMDLSNSGRSPFASESVRMVSSKQNRAIDEVAKRTGADPEEVRRAIYGTNNTAPVEFMDLRIKPRSPQEMANMDSMSIEDIDDARKIALRNGNTKRLAQLDVLRKIKVDEDEHMATKWAVGDPVKFQKRDEKGNLMVVEGTLNDDGWVRLKQPDGSMSEPKQIRTLGEAQPIAGDKETPKGMTEEQLFQKRNVVDQNISNYNEMVRITREVDTIIKTNPDAALRINEAFKSINLYANEILYGMKTLGLPFQDAVEAVADKYSIDLPEGSSELMFYMEDYTYSRLGINDQEGREASNPEVDRGLIRLMRAGPERLVSLMKTGTVRGREKAVQSYNNTVKNLGPKYADYWDDGWATADIDDWIDNQLGSENLEFLGRYNETELLKNKREAEKAQTGQAPAAPLGAPLIEDESGFKVFGSGD